MDKMLKPKSPKSLNAKKIHFSFFQSKAKTIFARPTQSAAVASQETANTLNSIQTINNDTSRVKKTSKYI